MIEGAHWRRWVFFYIPMAVFLIFLLFPFYWMIITSVRPDGELYRPWNAINYTPFWTWKPTLGTTSTYLFAETLFSSWLLEHDVHRARSPRPSRSSAACSPATRCRG